jgi:hypothetical protein
MNIMNLPTIPLRTTDKVLSVLVFLIGVYLTASGIYYLTHVSDFWDAFFGVLFLAIGVYDVTWFYKIYTTRWRGKNVK